MAGKKKKELFFRDTFNSFANTKKYFHWSKAYNWHSYLCVEDITLKHLRTIGLVKIGCMPEVFSVPEFVLWHAKHYDASRRTILIGDNTIHPISLNPLAFQRMLRLLGPSKEFKLPEIDDYVMNHGGPKRLLAYFIDSLSRLKLNCFQFDIDILKDPFREFAWLSHGSPIRSPRHIFLGMSYLFSLVLSK